MELHVKSFFLKLTGLLALSLCIFSNCLAQPDTTVTLHYPLNIGDYWDYSFGEGGGPFIETRVIIGDTIMPNGKKYSIIEKNAVGFTTREYQRVDSSKVYLYGGAKDILLFKLNLKVNDTWPYYKIPLNAIMKVTHVGDTLLFSKVFKYARIPVFDLPDTTEGFGPEFILLDSLGIYYNGFEGGYAQLRGAVIAGKGYGIFTSVDRSMNQGSDNRVESVHNYPNPFNNSTVIQYKLHTAGQVRISIFNQLGARISVLYDDFQNPVLHRIQWFGKNSTGIPVSSGIYFYTIRLDHKILAKNSLLFFRRN